MKQRIFAVDLTKMQPEPPSPVKTLEQDHIKGRDCRLFRPCSSEPNCKVCEECFEHSKIHHSKVRLNARKV